MLGLFLTISLPVLSGVIVDDWERSKASQGFVDNKTRKSPARQPQKGKAKGPFGLSWLSAPSVSHGKFD